MKGMKFFQLITSALVLLFIAGNAIAAVDIKLSGPSTAASGGTFDITGSIDGSGTAAGVDIVIPFDKAKVQMTAFTSSQGTAASATGVDKANELGKVVVNYVDMNLVGLDASTKPEIGKVTFKALADGDVTFTLDAASVVSDPNFTTITGDKTSSVIVTIGGAATTTTTTVATTTTTLPPATTTTTAAATTTTTAAATTTTTAAATTTTTAAATTTTTSVTTTTVAGCSVAGDVNNDGKKDIYDALAIAEYDVGKITNLACLGNADVDGDGKVTIYDALKIAETIVGRSI